MALLIVDRITYRVVAQMDQAPVVVLKKIFLQVDQATHSVMGRQMGHLVQRNAWHPTAIRHIIHLMHQSSKIIKCPNPTMFNILNQSLFRPNVALAAAREAPNSAYLDAHIAKQINILHKIIFYLGKERWQLI